MRANPANPEQRDRPRARIGLPLCFCASLTLHVGLMAMSSVWLTGGLSHAHGDKARDADPEDAEVDAVAILFRLPAGGGGADEDSGGAGRGESSGGAGAESQSTTEQTVTAGSAQREGGSLSTVPDGDGAACPDLDDAQDADPTQVATQTSLANAVDAGVAPVAADDAPSDPAFASPLALDVSPDAATAEPPQAPAHDEDAARVESRAPSTTAVALPVGPFFVPSALSADAAAALVLPHPPAGRDASAANAMKADAPMPSTPAPNPPVPVRASDSDSSARASEPSSERPGSADGGSDADGRAGEHGSGAAAGGSRTGSSSHPGERGDGSGLAGDGHGRGGGGVGGPAAVLRFAPRPEYPAASVRRGEEGRVVCTLHVDVDGHVTQVDVVRSSGHPLLDRAATETLVRWRFLPAREHGRPVACRVPHCVTFRLE